MADSPHFILIDRDGVVNADREDYVKNVSELVIFDWAPPAIARASQAGYSVAIVSNQQGVARGLITEADLAAIETEILRQVHAAGGEIVAFEYCKHLAEENCDCRKPKPGMLLDLQRRFGFSLKDTPYIGDSPKDVQAALAAGCRSILVLSGYTNIGLVPVLPDQPDLVCAHLGEAIDWILTHDPAHLA